MKIVSKAIAKLSLLTAVTSAAILLAGCETPAGGGAAGNNNIESLKTAANGGDADAAYKLGEIYRLGRGVPKNYVEAESWHKKAAELYGKLHPTK